MNEEKDIENDDHGTLAENIGGIGQKIIGEIEMIGGILTGSPNTIQEGEFNTEVGELREDLEEELEDTESDTE